MTRNCLTEFLENTLETADKTFSNWAGREGKNDGKTFNEYRRVCMCTKRILHDRAPIGMDIYGGGGRFVTLDVFAVKHCLPVAGFYPNVNSVQKVSAIANKQSTIELWKTL